MTEQDEALKLTAGFAKTAQECIDSRTLMVVNPFAMQNLLARLEVAEQSAATYMAERNQARDVVLSYREENGDLQVRLALVEQDAARLNYLDRLNAALNRHYGTTYRWKLVLSPNVVRLMAGPGGDGRVASIDLHDSDGRGVLSCRDAIDAELAKERG